MAGTTPEALRTEMTTPMPPSRDEMTAFARRYGLDKLTPEHIARMAELAVHVGALGRTLRRPPAKENFPAPTFEIEMRGGG